MYMQENQVFILPNIFMSGIYLWKVVDEKSHIQVTSIDLVSVNKDMKVNINDESLDVIECS